MAVNFTRSFTALCCVALWSFSTASGATYVLPPHSTTKPGFPVPMNTDNPGVRKAARFGVYRYNNSSNDLFLFKESQINKAMVQVRRAQTSGGPPNHLPIDSPTEHPRYRSPDPPQDCYGCLKINSSCSSVPFHCSTELGYPIPTLVTKHKTLHSTHNLQRYHLILSQNFGIPFPCPYFKGGNCFL
ncbi:cystatin-F isoform X1 [Pezoporus flaviventris]|uniref:cystatin-F isoform X1 n=1 Tax=Pezoporus flaviventris TaxID=889875 RepID=UPI002AB26F31|nr:cystatin-F isoform X1 [Pezoporus flaviventris]